MERTGTSSLDAELRIRLEGAGEVLEAAIPRLDELTRRLAGGPRLLDRDDLVELRTVLAELPGLDEALEKAERLEPARALAQDARRAQEALWNQARATLEGLDRSTGDAGLAETLRQLIRALKYLGRAAGPRERVLFTGTPSGPWLPFALFGLLGVSSLAAMHWPIPAVLFGLATWLLWTRSGRTSWRMLPDRLQLEALHAPLLDVQYEDITGVTAGASEVEVHAEDLVLKLPTRNPEALARLLRSMHDTMGSAGATPQPSVIVPVALGDGDRGTAVFTAQGAFVVLESDERTALARLLPGADGTKIEDALDLLRHLPPEVLAQRIKDLPGTWWPADETRVVETANASLTRVFERNGDTLRVTFGLAAQNDAKAQLDSVTAGWKR